jgi:hypothetical protein
MPAQGNVTAPLAVLRMKKPFIHEKKPNFLRAVRPTGASFQQSIGTANQCQYRFWEQHVE